MKDSTTGLKDIDFSEQTWNDIMKDNMRILDEDLLYITALGDVDATGLVNGDLIKWDEAGQDYIRVAWNDVFTTTTTTTTTS